MRARLPLLLASTLALAACGDAAPRVLPPELDDEGDGPAPILDPLTSDRDLDGWLDVAEVAMGTDPDSFDRPCARAEVETEGALETLNARLDLVVLIDTSGSMFQELPSVRAGLLATLARAEAGGDLIRVIVVSGERIWCDTGDCAPPDSPNLTYVDRVVSSRDTFDAFLETYAQRWSGELRSDASIAVLNITDDDSRQPWRTFEQRLRATAQRAFFPNGRRGYTWHSATGAALAADAFAGPTSDLVTAPCATAPNAGLEYQELSRFTGGLRFSVCGENDYTRVLDEVVFTATRPAECAIALRTSGGEIDASRSTVQIEVEGERPEVLSRVGEACLERGYYVVGDYLVLCDEVCDALEGESVRIRAGAQCACDSSPTIGCVD